MVPIRLLIADYSLGFAREIVARLAGNSRIEIVGVAVSGPEVVDMAQDLRPDIVLMNDKLPVINGCEATRMIIRDGFVPVVVMSKCVGTNYAGTWIQVLAARGVDLIGKPDMRNDSAMTEWLDLLTDKIFSFHAARCLLNRLKRSGVTAFSEAA